MVLIVVILLHYVFMNCEENILRLNVFFLIVPMILCFWIYPN